MNRTHDQRRRALLAAPAIASLLLPAYAQDAPAQPVRYEYDPAGNLVRMIDERGVATTQRFDRFNQMAQRVLPAPAPGAAPGTVALAHDHRGRVARSTDPRGLATTFRVDGLGNLVAVDSPESGQGTMEYDAAGRLESVRDARGQVTSFSYDPLGRVTRIHAHGGIPARLDYDAGGAGATGRLSRMVDESGETRYRYDDAGRLLEKTQVNKGRKGPLALTVGYTYGSAGGALGKVESITYPSGNRVVFGYAANGKVAEMTLYRPRRTNPEPLLANIEYEPFGGPRGWEWAGRHSHREPASYLRERDLDGRIVRYTLSDSRRKSLTRTIVYDAAGRIERFVHSGELKKPEQLDQSFSYDDLGRLTGYLTRNTSQAFEYDASGNRTRAIGGHDEYRFELDANSNRMLSAQSVEKRKTWSYTYDEAGGVLDDGRLAYTYGPAGRIKSVRDGDRSVSYLYNGLGQRVAKEGDRKLVRDGVRLFVYDEQGRMLGEYGAAGQAVEETIFLGDTPVVVLKAPDEHANEHSMKVHYVYADHLDTPRVIERGNSGKIVWRWDDADPFGEALPDGGNRGRSRAFYNRRFPAQYYDRESRLNFAQGRSYDPRAGRFGQPIAATASLPVSYPYAIGNPLLDLGSGAEGEGRDGTRWREWIGDPAREPACPAGAAPAASAPAWQPPAPVPGTRQAALVHLGQDTLPAH